MDSKDAQGQVPPQPEVEKHQEENKQPTEQPIQTPQAEEKKEVKSEEKAEAKENPSEVTPATSKVEENINAPVETQETAPTPTPVETQDTTQTPTATESQAVNPPATESASAEVPKGTQAESSTEAVASSPPANEPEAKSAEVQQEIPAEKPEVVKDIEVEASAIEEQKTKEEPAPIDQSAAEEKKEEEKAPITAGEGEVKQEIAPPTESSMGGCSTKETQKDDVPPENQQPVEVKEETPAAPVEAPSSDANNTLSVPTEGEKRESKYDNVPQIGEEVAQSVDKMLAEYSSNSKEAAEKVERLKKDADAIQLCSTVLKLQKELATVQLEVVQLQKTVRTVNDTFLNVMELCFDKVNES
ncbi:DgyrCDS4457 [Dimorphilus gyrociliatus]|uniref:DgyrCDS4457 n=1 Tax=Dimorphilus gyrociliatus TaxID=2664684 RepID=A0A7I8VH41_9ANNE|nr:DgyrCDS4457 [Dimorphilus gyrociliatus]